MTKLTDLIGSYDNLEETPNTLNHPGNILAIVIVFMVLTWCCALLRLYTRFFIIRAPGWDDFFIVLALLSTTAGSITICVMARYAGMGTHFALMSDAQMIQYLKTFYVANATYPGSAGFIKLALLFQYLRVYDAKSSFRLATKIVIVLTALWGVIYSIMAWIPTVPVKGYWHLEMSAYRYGFGSLYVRPFVTIYTSLTASNMILDMIILALAAPLLLVNKKSDKVSRWSLVSLFTLGSLASIFSIWRLASIVQSQATTYPTFDPTWYGAIPIVLAALEVDVATITASLPVFWPVLRDISISQIMVTREVKVTLEERRTNTGGTISDPDDEGIELQRSESGLQVNTNRSDHYDDPYVAQQVDPFGGTRYNSKDKIDVSGLGRNTSITVHGKTEKL